VLWRNVNRKNVTFSNREKCKEVIFETTLSTNPVIDINPVRES
jgi:hypothetical protein